MRFVWVNFFSEKTKDEINLIIERKQADLTVELNRQIADGEKKIALFRASS